MNENDKARQIKDRIELEIKEEEEKYKSKDRQKNCKERPEREIFDFGVTGTEQILPCNCWKGDVILIEGPRGTFKKTLAQNFLLSGVVSGENVLYIRLHDRPEFNPYTNIRISRELRKELQDVIHLNMLFKLPADNVDRSQIQAVYEDLLEHNPGKYNPLIVKIMREELSDSLANNPYVPKGYSDEKWKKFIEEKTKIYQTIFAPHEALDRTTTKLSSRTYTYNKKMRFTELAFKSGYIFPEEFIQNIRDILLREKEENFRITRVVFDDVGLIGVSYPLLKRSKTAGDLFLTAFVHIIRNYEDISLVMTGTTHQYSEADGIISRARVLADTVLKCSFCDVFGNRYVVIEGEGLTTKGHKVKPEISKEYGEYTPGVIVPYEHHNTSTFEIDLKRLEGLVGFGTANLHRPGITFRTFMEGGIQRKYNQDVGRMLANIFGYPQLEKDSEKERIDDSSTTKNVYTGNFYTGALVESFTAYDSKVMHDSLDILEGRPLDRTIVSTVDEFCRSKERVIRAGNGNGTKEDSSLDERVFVDLTELLKQIVKEEYTKSKLKNENKLKEAYEDWYIKPFKVKWNEPIYGFPYYSSVLLLAYRKKDNGGNELVSGRDLLKWIPAKRVKQKKSRQEGYFKLQSWQDVNKFAEMRLEELKRMTNESVGGKNNNRTHKVCKFEYYHYAEETLSCVLLDTLVSGFMKMKGHKTNKEIKETLLDILKEKLSYSQLEELLALQELLSASHEYRQDQFGDEWNRLTQGLEDEEDQISPDAAVYLCWYSQLRELIQKYPGLANKLDVCALPGGGFRGDWYLGVAKGSVSIELGKSIVRILCSMKEEYKRFAQGIGLPTLACFYEPEQDFFAWPQGEHVKVRNLGKIHGDAWTRGSIEGYGRFRSVLHTVCKQLIRHEIKTYKINDRKKLIRENISRLAGQVKMLGRS